MTWLTTSTTNVIYVGALSCNQSDVTPYLQVPLLQQPAVAILDYFDDSVTRAASSVVQVPVIAAIRFEFGTRSQ